MIEKHFTGAIQSPKDSRDYEYSEIAFSSKPFDWDAGYDIENEVGKLPVKDQLFTSACGGFAWSTLSYVLDQTNREEKSEKFIYAQTHVPGGGSAGRTNCELCVKKGVSSKTLCPLPNPLTEAEITRIDDITAEAYANALTNKEKSYLSVNCDMETIAQAIRDNKGVVIGISGQNNGTWRTFYPQKPTSNDVWRHWVYAGKALKIGGKNYIGFLNSWGKDCGDSGWQYISEDYFEHGKLNPFIWECWAMTYNPQTIEDNHHMFYKTLKFGSQGEEVKALQEKLQFLGFYPKNLPTDIFFGRLTLASVKAFQKAKGLIADGIVGPKTNKELNK